MQLAIPWITAATAILGVGWAIAIGHRARRARERYAPADAPSPIP